MPLLAYGLVALAVLGMLGGIGYKIRESGKESVRLEWAEANATAREEEIQRSIMAAGALSADRAKRRTIIQERTEYVDKIVDRIVYRNVCLDPDGLRCLEEAILGKGSAGCKPDRAVPAASPSG